MAQHGHSSYDSYANFPVTSYESLGKARVALVAIYFAVAIWYLTWRLGTFNPDAPIFSYLLYGAELFGFATTVVHLFMVWRLTNRKAPEADYRWTVDVFVPTLNEPLDMVRRTVMRAMAMDFPHQTWILDDGGRPAMREMAEDLGCVYVARQGNEHAKAGNLNYALKLSKADFIAVFDADHAPKSAFLTRTLGYFHDANVAFVQTPQDFYNLDSFQHQRSKSGRRVWTEQSLFFRVIQRGKDFWNAAFYCGSCAVIRRSALLSIGGFATGTVTEDLHTSVRLHKEGYSSVYHEETLALGVAPSQIKPFISQRIRWGQGAMQVWKKEGILFARGLTFPQRLCYLASMVTYFDGWQKMVFYTSPIIVLLFGIMPVQTVTSEFFLHFIPYFIISFWLFEEVSRGYGDPVQIERYNMVRFAAFAWATLGLLKSNLKFKVTDKALTARSGMNLYLTPHYLLLIASGLAVGSGIYQIATDSTYLATTSLFANIFWASVNLLLAGSLVSFTFLRQSYRRKEYRFPVPLAAEVHLGTRRAVMASVANISSSGAQITGNFSDKVRLGEAIRGTLYLPDGPLTFEGRVRSRVTATRNQSLKAVGCSFQWQDQAARDRLDMFLYGSDLQWHLNQFSERKPTLLERLFGSRNVTEIVMPDKWASISLRSVNDDTVALQSAALSTNPHTRKASLLTYQPVEEGSMVETRILSDGQEITVRGRVVNQKRVENGSANLYWYELDEERQVA